MQKRVLGYLLTIMGFGGMVLAGYLFVTGTGGRINLLEVTCYMIVGATCFFTGLNYVYEAARTFTNELEHLPELEEVSAIQQQWRTIHITKETNVREVNAGKAAAVSSV